MLENIKILLCDDDPLFQIHLKKTLAEKMKNQYDFLTANDSEEALSLFQYHSFDLLLLDINLREPREGLRAIPRFLEIDRDLVIVINSIMSDFQVVREALRLGAVDYIVKDIDSEDLLHTFTQALSKRKHLKHHQQLHLKAQSTHTNNILLGESPPIKKLHQMIHKVKNSRANVIITGETGTGKELVAKQLRRILPNDLLEPFIAINSSTIQDSMAESILFGHERGAFTGADRTVKGIFEQAHGGTLYFDEISTMPIGIQSKLLRVIQEKEITRLGSSKVIPIDFRLICATNKNLEKMSQQNTFKDDLLHRINVISLETPPLRDRIDDLPLLIEHFILKYCPPLKKLIFSDCAIEALKTYSWPGNVRELGNLIDQLITLHESPEVFKKDLPERFQQPSKQEKHPDIKPRNSHYPTGFYEKILAFERELLKEEYMKHEGNMSQLASALGMNRAHLYCKLKELGIHFPRNSSSKNREKKEP